MGKITGSGTAGETTLFDVWAVLQRRRYSILLGVAVVALSAVAYLSVASPVYRASAKVRVGQFAGAGPFESAAALSARLLAEYGEYAADGVRREPPTLRSAAETRQGSAVIELQVEGRRPEVAAQMLAQIVNAIRARHDETYELALKASQERLRLLDSQRSALSRDYDEGRRLFEVLKDKDAVQASVLTLELGRIASLIAQLDTERPELVRSISPPRTERTELLGEIVPPTQPAIPRVAMVAALASMLGLLFGVMLALLSEFLATARNRAARASE